MGCCLCQILEFYDLEFKCWQLWKLTGIYKLKCMILVFTHHTGIYVPYWYLRIILVFTHYTGIYIRIILVFMFDTGIYAPCWYLSVMLIFVCHTSIYDTGICARCWNLCMILVFMCTPDAGIDIDYSSYPWLVSCAQVAIGFINQNN